MPSFASPRAPVTVSFLHSKMAPKKKCKAKAKAKAGADPSAKKQKTKATAAEDELQLVQWQPQGGKSGLMFHNKRTKMRKMLQYRSSAKCKKAYIYMYTYHVSS